ncbi:MAG: hypothetical protein ACLFVO_03515 [Chloroflexaceae bacterium]
MPRLPSRYVRQMPSSGRIFAYAVIIVVIALLPLFLSNIFEWGGLLRSAVLPLAALLTFGLILAFSMLHMQPRVLFGEYGGRLALAFAVVLGLGVFAFVTDYSMRVTTLYETLLPASDGAADGSALPVHTVTFAVEHPGVEHRLYVSPVGRSRDAIPQPVTLRFALQDAAGVTLVAGEETFTPRRDTQTGKVVWSGIDRAFTPRRPGLHTLVVTAVTPGIPEIHVRVVDPHKRDGTRPPGY